MPASDLRTDRIWMDGAMVPFDEAKVHVLTHSLHYGVGVFEGIRCYATDDGRSAIFRARDHIRRLYDSAHILEMKIPFSHEEVLKACADIVRVNKLKECYIRPIVFYGEGEMGVSARHNKVHTVIAAWKWGVYLGVDGVAKGVRLKTSSFVRFHHNSMMPHAKSTANYMNSVLANHEATRAGYDEALLLDVDGFVAEGSGENIFAVRDGVVKTPPNTSALPGITRDAVIRILGDAGIAVVEQRFPRDLMYIADEAFMTGTAAEVTPIRELDDRLIGGGSPGPLTRRVQQSFQAALRGREPRYADWLYFV